MKKALFFALCLLAFLKTIVAQSSTLDEVANLSEVLAFFNGQSKSLDRIKNEFPDLKDSVTLAELRWDAQFGKVKVEVEKQLRFFLKDQYDEGVAQGYQKFKEFFPKANLSKNDAIAFIKLVNERTQGLIEKEIRPKILMYHPDFMESPAQEFLTGFVNELRTVGTEEKAQGIKFRIWYPGSWGETAVISPDVLLNVSSKNGTGNVSMKVVVKDLTLDKSQYSKSRWDYITSLEGNKVFADSLFTENQLIEALKESGLKDQKFSQYRRIQINANPAATITYSGTTQKEGVELAMNFIHHVLICKNHIVYITFSCSADSVEASKDEFNKYLLTFIMSINMVAVLNRFD